jgi:hypothetical protein
MDRLKHQLIIAIVASLLTPIAYASSYGVSLTYPAHSKAPENIHGLQAMLTYDPKCFTWRQFNIYFDGGISYFTVPDALQHRNIGIFSAAPVIRYRFKQRGPVKPYLDLSIGLAYLTQTHFDDHNLGVHYAFQDRIGAGVVMGDREQFSLGVSTIHYSNAHLSARNAGITILLMLNAAYTFA